jgi:hypothetical protein
VGVAKALRGVALAVAVCGQIAFPSRSSATHVPAQGPAASCPEVQSIRVSKEIEGDVLRDRAPETAEMSIVSASTGPHATVTVTAIGPVLGSMDAPSVETASACDAKGVVVTATTTRSAAYVGAVLKNVLWRPRLEIVLAPRTAGTTLTTTWKMRLTTGAEVQHTRMPPYPEMSYPVTVTKQIRRGSGYDGTGGAVSMKTDRLADGNGTRGVKIGCVHQISNYRPGAPRVVDTVPPTISIRATPSILWPPNGNLVTVTVSGTIQDNPGGSGVDTLSACFFVVDQYRKVQPSGGVTVARDGTYSFTVQLKATREGNDPDGRVYNIAVNASDNNGNAAASAVARVIVSRGQTN